jgi:hypothetical protein
MTIGSFTPSVTRVAGRTTLNETASLYKLVVVL